MKKLLSLFLSVLMLLSLPLAAFASGDEIEAVKINPYGGEEAGIDTVSWFDISGKYFLFLPADTDLNAAKVYFDASGDVTLDGAPVVSGESAAAFTEGEHTLACGETTCPLTVCLSANIPAVFITTQSGSLSYIHADKENKEPGNIRIYENGEMTLDKELKQIKGRGNASWGAPKKPYNIKFDKKQNLFGMGKAKKWTLLANYYDESLLRNVYGWEYAKAFGLQYTSEYQHVDLFINGEYLGNYVICESVEVDSERIAVNDLDKANEDANPDLDLETLPQAGTGANGAILPGTAKGSAKWIDIPVSPDDISGGYLLEYEFADRYNSELCGFVTDNGQPVVIKSPELASEAEVRYIQAMVNDAANALYADSGCNAKGKHYSEYFDTDSLVNMYILQELSANIDAGFTSLFLYKAENSDKLVFSPVWDMDHAFGDEIVRFGVNNGEPGVWWTNSLGYDLPTVFNAAFRHAEFKTAVRARWEALSAQDVFADVMTAAHALSERLGVSAAMNMIRWNSAAASDPAAMPSMYSGKVSVGETFIERRCAALSKGFSENAAMLYYNANGGAGSVFNPYIALTGEAVTVIDRVRGENRISSPGGGYLFTGWNTAPDGSGTTYQPGDTITLAGAVTTLYAVWKTQAEIDAEDETEPITEPDNSSETKQSFLERILAFFQRIIIFFRRLFRVGA